MAGNMIDVIPETVNTNGSASNSITDIPHMFYTSDRKLEKI